MAPSAMYTCTRELCEDDELTFGSARRTSYITIVIGDLTLVLSQHLAVIKTYACAGPVATETAATVAHHLLELACMTAFGHPTAFGDPTCVELKEYVFVTTCLVW